MNERPCQVLFVDDDDVNILTFGMLLDERGYEVTKATSLAEARAHLARGRFDLAVLDVHVGHETSPQLVPEMRLTNPGMRVVFLSGSLRHEEQLPGADLVLGKGEDPERLLAAIDEVARGARS